MKSYINKLKKLYKNKSAYQNLLSNSNNVGIFAGGNYPKFTVVTPSTLSLIGGLNNIFLYEIQSLFTDNVIISKAYLIDLSNNTQINLTVSNRTSQNRTISCTISDDLILPDKTYLLVYETNKKRNSKLFSPINLTTTYPYNIPSNKLADQYTSPFNFAFYGNLTNIVIETSYILLTSNLEDCFKHNVPFSPPYAIKMSLDVNNYPDLNFVSWIGVSTDLVDSPTDTGRNGIMCNVRNGSIQIKRSGQSPITLVSQFDGYQDGDNFRLVIIEMNNILFVGRSLTQLRGFNTTGLVDNNIRYTNIIQSTRRQRTTQFFDFNASSRWKIYAPNLADPGP